MSNEGSTVAVYDYQNADGVVLFRKERIEFDDGRKKTFRLRMPNGEYGLVEGVETPEPPLNGAAE